MTTSLCSQERGADIVERFACWLQVANCGLPASTVLQTPDTYTLVRRRSTVHSSTSTRMRFLQQHHVHSYSVIAHTTPYSWDPMRMLATGTWVCTRKCVYVNFAGGAIQPLQSTRVPFSQTPALFQISSQLATSGRCGGRQTGV